MSAIKDALTALKNVVLMQERLDVMRTEQSKISDGVRGLNDYISSVDKRVVRIETMIEMSGRAGDSPRLEG